jgi:hypothetical protein
MQLHSEVHQQGCGENRHQSEKGRRRSPFCPGITKFIFIIYGLLKMTRGQHIPDPDPKLINAQSFDFAKPKLFFKNISHYAATSTYIHMRIPLNITTVFDTKTQIARVYAQLLDKHGEPFQALMKSVTDVLEDFHNIIKALPHTTELSMPG